MRSATAIIVLAGAGLLASPAAAQSKDGKAVLDAITACRALADDAARLACFDRAASELEAKQRGGLVVLDRAEVREKRRSLFGLKLPDIALFGRDEAKEPPIQEVTSTVSRVSPAGRDLFQLRLADGSTWRTTEATRFEPENGDPVVIRRGALGGYRASFAKQFPVRVERIQ